MQEDLFIEETSADTTQGPAFELKGSSFTLPILRLLSSDLASIERGLSDHLAKNASFFENAPFVVDVEHLSERGWDVDFSLLCELMRSKNIVPVGVRGANQEQQASAINAGMAVLTGGALQSLTVCEPAPLLPPTISYQFATKVIDQPVRSGQQIYARDADLVILGSVSGGAEVIADGSIHIYGALRGRALAGASGSENTRIFAQILEPELVSVAGNYQIFEERLPESIHGKAGQVYLFENKLSFLPIGR